jgi:hypothetical protein
MGMTATTDFDETASNYTRDQAAIPKSLGKSLRSHDLAKETSKKSAPHVTPGCAEFRTVKEGAIAFAA